MTVKRVRSLHLIAVGLPHDRTRPCDGALVPFDPDVVLAGLAVVLDPVVHRRASDQIESVLFEVKEDDVADHVAVVIAGDELLGLARSEILEAVHAEHGEHLERVRSLHVHVGHVVRLVEQDARVPPGALFVSPVRELAGDDRVDVRSGLRIAQQFDRTAGGVQHVLEALVTHSVSFRIRQLPTPNSRLKSALELGVRSRPRGPHSSCEAICAPSARACSLAHIT